MEVERPKKIQHREADKNEEDKISDLSDCVLIHILSFLNTKEAVQTCILSKRWINLWKKLSTLTLSTSDFKTNENLEKFASQLLSLRDHSTALSDLRLCANHLAIASPFQKTIEYAVSHNVKHLLVNLAAIEHFPSCFFSCLTLTTLNLSAYNIFFNFGRTIIFPDFFNLPELTTLSLKYFTFCGTNDGCVEPFSAFNKLNTLIIDRCEVFGAKKYLRISSAKLVNLTIHMYGCDSKKYSKTSFGIELYYAPSLHAFAFTGGECIQELSGSESVLSSIKHLNIHLPYCWNLRENSLILLNWLVQLANIESLIISSKTLKVLSYYPDLLKVKFDSFCNLKTLKIKMDGPHGPSSIPQGMLDFLLQNSPSAKVDFINLFIRPVASVNKAVGC
ncbi:F-box/FBD/LRR-repeat protein At5g53840-like [Trifolium pratense]|uniref:F-box/FBD/LRR-repeat protein At5g53840-like n=1 Tax=Trifolium pratense TaxID=57577 RepID=UPI001E697E11|nr:F-box/FBD/LRR-repeat protein At5g53840-like [Trifolium pratense]XP_045824243.1 F-box/FBD/LRR-repeat protein At5g53840-like [Trifolium pratense]